MIHWESLKEQLKEFFKESCYPLVSTHGNQNLILRFFYSQIMQSQFPDYSRDFFSAQDFIIPRPVVHHDKCSLIIPDLFPTILIKIIPNHSCDTCHLIRPTGHLLGNKLLQAADSEQAAKESLVFCLYA